MTKKKTTKTKRQRVGGRKTQYKPEWCARAVAMGREGKTLAALAGEIGVTTQTLRDWAKAHPEFDAALTMAKEQAAAWWEETARVIGRGGGGNGTVTIFMLCNYLPGEYKQKQETVIGADNDLLAALKAIEG